MAANWIPKIEYGVGPTTITFEYPPKGPKVRGKQLKHIGTRTTSKSGAQQTITDFIEENNTINLSHVSEVITGQLETFFLTHGFLGKSFDYYFDKDDVATKVTVKLDESGTTVNFDEQLSTAVDAFLYKLKLKLTRVR